MTYLQLSADPSQTAPTSAADVTILIPHFNTPGFLRVAYALWRTLHPDAFILIVDNSPHSAEAFAVVDEFRAKPNTEVAWLAPGRRRHQSEQVTAALDYAFSRCETRYLFSTHSDLFPRCSSLIPAMRALASEAAPVVGWEMSKRPTDSSEDFSAGFTGHVSTIYHMPTMRKLGVTHSIQRFVENSGDERRCTGWPDTESCLGMVLKQSGVAPVLLGRETNWENQDVGFWVHARSLTVCEVFGDGPLDRHQAALSDAIRHLDVVVRGG